MGRNVFYSIGFAKSLEHAMPAICIGSPVIWLVFPLWKKEIIFQKVLEVSDRILIALKRGIERLLNTTIKQL